MSYKTFCNAMTVSAIALALGMTACSSPSTEESATADSPAETTEQPADAEQADSEATEAPADVEKTAMEVDQTEPANVVQAVFDAAKAEDFKSLKGLCDPMEESDEDTQRICNLATDDKDKGEFVESFANGKVNGEVEISDDGKEATVPVAMGPGGENEEKVKLVNREGKWYLSSF